MKNIAFIISIIILIVIFLKKEKISKKILITSLIFYFLISTFFFILKKTGILSNHQWLIAVYVSIICIIAYILVLFIAKLIINKLLKFQIEKGKKSHPFITKFIKNKSLIHSIYCLVFLISISMGLYAIWFKSIN
ncbi:hypothetical protein [Olleya sp. AS48]|uniref:hypothetical protein n=1 Tax=Olleya sp. AS48 TaxID=3135774 RepID=UPI0030DD87DC|tara:strand:- start:3231 stop:3635 length:405 start_codon:yes stop_codon:yes gene_type:complete